MIRTTIFLLSVLVLVVRGQQPAAAGYGQPPPEPPHPAPEPYSFTYESPNEDGSSSARQETGDANGRVTGFYIIKGADGQDRRVDYYADETGFHAEVSTNEIGTVTHEAASASYRSSAPSVADLAAAWEASAGGANRASSSSSGSSSSSRYSSASTTSSGGANSGRIASAGGAAGGGSIRTSSSVFSSEVRQTGPASIRAPAPAPAPSGSSIVTPEGFVLVKASAARTAGLNVIGPEITSLQGLQPTGPSTGAARPFGGARPGRK